MTDAPKRFLRGHARRDRLVYKLTPTDNADNADLVRRFTAALGRGYSYEMGLCAEILEHWPLFRTKMAQVCPRLSFLFNVHPKDFFGLSDYYKTEVLTRYNFIVDTQTDVKEYYVQPIWYFRYFMLRWDDRQHTFEIYGPVFPEGGWHEVEMCRDHAEHVFYDVKPVDVIRMFVPATFEVETGKTYKAACLDYNVFHQMRFQPDACYIYNGEGP